MTHNFTAAMHSAIERLSTRADRMRSIGRTGITSERVPGGPGFRAVNLAVNVANERRRWYVNGRGVAYSLIVDRARKDAQS